MNFLSISLVLFVVAINRRYACGLEYAQKFKDVTTPNPNSCGGALHRFLVPHLINKTHPDRQVDAPSWSSRWFFGHKVPSASKQPKGFVANDTPKKQYRTRWHFKLRLPTGTREAQGLTFTDFAADPSSLSKDNVPFTFGGLGGVFRRLKSMLAPHFTDETPNLPPRNKAPSVSRRVPGFLSPYFANAPHYSPVYVPYASEGVREIHAAPLATVPGYSHHEFLPRDNIASAFGGPHGLLAHYYEDQQRNSLLKMLLQNLLSPVPSFHKLYFGNHAPHNRLHRLDKPPVTRTPRPLHSYGPNQLRELLGQVMHHRSTNPKTTLILPPTNQYRGYIYPYNFLPSATFPRTVFRS